MAKKVAKINNKTSKSLHRHLIHNLFGNKKIVRGDIWRMRVVTGVIWGQHTLESRDKALSTTTRAFTRENIAVRLLSSRALLYYSSPYCITEAWLPTCARLWVRASVRVSVRVSVCAFEYVREFECACECVWVWVCVLVCIHACMPECVRN